MFQKFQNAILLAPVVENLLELATIAFMLNYSKSFLPVHYERPISGMAFPVADDEGFGQSQIPLPLMPPIKSANCLCFKLSSKLCLNCNFANKMKEASVFDKKYYCNMKIGQQFSENAAIGLSFYLHGHGRLFTKK